jgi:copper chaperone NosL
MMLAIDKSKEEKTRFTWVVSSLLCLAGMALLASLVFPIWRITLEAPQYPEGLGMQIWARTITGEGPEDLNIINALNHYIGMKKIIPESIPELRFIQPLVFIFAFFCFLIAIRPRIWSLSILIGALSALGAYGMYDFWKWEYDYGHNLNPMAAIKVPGMSYQPPLIGSAKLLNFLSTSWPALGGYLIFLAGGLIALSLMVLWISKFKLNLATVRNSSGPAASALFLFCLLLWGCERQGPVPFLWGEDACHACKMTLVQKGFAVQRINDKGKVFKYDAIECLLEEIKTKPLGAQEQIYVSDWSRPEAALVPAQQSYYLKSEKIASPMGGALASFQFKDSAMAFQGRMGGDVLAWAGLKKF